jgi:phospholipid/cholesterol/gamma-HCH transport system ATP-binding protein
MIEVKDLDGFYGRRQVLFDIRVSIPRERITVIMGPSGCGKTTLFKHLIGLIRPPCGQILVEGTDLACAGSRAIHAFRRRIGVLFQGGALFNSFSLTQNLAVPLQVHTRLAPETMRIITQIKLHQVGLSEFGDYMPSQLSGGMKKRAGLARALVMDPEILFVDEPSSGLDPITAAGLDELIMELRGALGMTIIVVTHELESAFRIADQMIVMDRGRVLESGSPEEIRNSGDPRVIQFLRRESDRHHSDTERYIASLMGQKRDQVRA